MAPFISFSFCISFLDRCFRAAGAGRIAVAVLLLGPFTPTASFAAQRAADSSQTLDGAIAAAGASDRERDELSRIYGALGERLQWASSARRSDVLKFLMNLEAEGIDAQMLGPLPGEARPSSVEDDVAATRAILRAAHILSDGAIDAAAIPGWHIKGAATDVVPMLVAALRGGKLETLMGDFRPSSGSYAGLRIAYAHYRRLAMERWVPIVTEGPRIVEHDDPRMSAVAERLVFLGDLKNGETIQSGIDLAVKQFQARHGLEPDGRVGPATLAQLNVSPMDRARQIAVNLEYWRLLPRSWPDRYVAVNIAAAQLDLMENGVSALASRVIVGDPRHTTPSMDARIASVTFNPPWSVPYSIASKEILPRLQRDPGYLERSNIEIVGRETDPHGLTVDWRAYSRGHFPFQLRQVPGPRNALGLVKFEMPNAFDVYLHDTPDHSLFERSARALSHGCVRVQCARELAERLIDDPALWLSGDVPAAIRGGRTVNVPLKQPLPVYLLYFTAFVDKDGLVNFRPDLYGRDEAAQRALAARRGL